jgi:signal transduction histidine kinase
VRNPLNSATLQLQLLERKLGKSELDPALSRETVHAIKSEIERLSRLADDFLAFAKPQRLNIAAVDLCDLIRDVMRQLATEAAGARVTLESDLDSAVGIVSVDESRMRQVLLNLIRNAIEALPDGDGTVLVRTYPQEVEANVIIDVEDDGPGFAADAPVFDAFYTTKDAGTGLGLAIVHRIVSEHGGTVVAAGGPPGARFRISLPQPALHRASDPAPGGTRPLNP